MTYTVYTDGSCSGNKRDAGCKGGFGYVILDSSQSMIMHGKGTRKNTTNNQMEMTAVIRGLEALIEYLKKFHGEAKFHDCIVKTDSKYISDNFIEYLPLWKSRNWRKSSGGPVLNVGLWKRIDNLTLEFKSFRFHWVKGHASNKWNKKADALATSYILHLTEKGSSLL